MLRRSKSTSNLPQQKNEAPKRSKSLTRAHLDETGTGSKLSVDVSAAILKGLRKSSFTITSPEAAAVEGASGWTLPKFLQGLESSAIKEIISTEMPQYVVDYLTAKFKSFNNEKEQKIAEEELKEHFAITLKADETFSKIITEIENMHLQKKKQNKELFELKTENAILKREIEIRLKRKLSASDFARWQHEVNKKKIARLTEQRDHLDAVVKTKKSINQDRRNVIKNQACSVLQKKGMLRNIEGLTISVHMKTAKLEKLKEARRDCDQKIAVIKPDLKYDIRSLNETVNEIAARKRELNVLHLDDTRIETAAFANILRAANNSVKSFRKRYQTEIQNLKLRITEAERETELFDQTIQTSKDTLMQLNEKTLSLIQIVKTLAERNDALVRQREVEKIKSEQSLKLLTKDEGDIDELKCQWKVENSLKKQNEEALAVKKKDFVQLYIVLREIVKHNVGQMNKILSQIYDLAQEKAQMVNVEVEEKVLDDGQK